MRKNHRTQREILRLLGERETLRFKDIQSYLKKHFNLTKGTTSNQLRDLTENSCVSRKGRGIYAITEPGKRYLRFLESLPLRRRKIKEIKGLVYPPFGEFKCLLIKGRFGRRVEVHGFLKDLGWVGSKHIEKVEKSQLKFRVEDPRPFWFEDDKDYVFSFFEFPGAILQFMFGKNGETFDCFSYMIGPDPSGILDVEMKSGSINPVRYLVAHVSPHLLMIDGCLRKHATESGLIINSVVYSGEVEENYYIKKEEKPWSDYLADFIRLGKGFKRVPKTSLKHHHY